MGLSIFAKPFSIFGGPFKFTDEGVLHIGDNASNSMMTTGLTIDQGANNDEILSLKNSGVAHGGTALTEADTFANISVQDSTRGGMVIKAYKETGGTANVLVMQGLLDGNSDTTKSTSAEGLVVLSGRQLSGDTVGDVVADGNVLVVRARVSGSDRSVAIVDEDGDLWLNNSITTGGVTPAGRTLDWLGGDFTASGGGTSARKLFISGALTGQSGDTGHLEVINLDGTVVTQTATESIGVIAQLYVDEPTITDNLTGDITIASTIYVTAAPTEGETNASIYIASGVFIQKDTTEATSGTTGSIHTDGGIGISENLFCAKALDTPDGMGADGEQLTSGGDNVAMDWAAAGSLSVYKDIHSELAPQDALDAILCTKPMLFNYRRETLEGDRAITTGDFETEYAGVLGEDAPWAMHHNGKIFSPVSAFGYTVAAIKAMEAEIVELREVIAELKGG